MVQGRALQRDESYRQRMCNIVGFYISCELCSAQEPVEKEETIINRINSCLKLYVEYGDGGAGVHREHVLRTLLAAPKLFNRASILSMLYRWVALFNSSEKDIWQLFTIQFTLVWHLRIQ